MSGQATTTATAAGMRVRAAEWVYRGLWGVLARHFRVPEHPPTLPVATGETLHAFKPSLGYLRYLKFLFWFWLTVIDGALLIGWLVLLIAVPMAGVVTLPIFLVVAVVPDVLAYLAIHLRYDTTWYLLSPRSLRIRRGIMTIHETTITFENVQNVEIRQGPVQRWFGVSNLRVQTAGGGGGSLEAGRAGSAAHVGLIEGVADAAGIRDLIMEHAARSRSAGLGDERDELEAGAGKAKGAGAAGGAWTPAHVAVLREIRDLARAAAETVSGG